MTLYRRIDERGEPTFGSTMDGEPLPDGAVEVERQPGPFEDFVDGAWVYNAVGDADFNAGPAHIAAAHLRKQIEAVLISSGHALPTGLIAAEATRREIEPAELAAIVLVKAAEFAAAELARQEPDIAAKKPPPGGTQT